jgi:hypothetical protein
MLVNISDKHHETWQPQMLAVAKAKYGDIVTIGNAHQKTRYYKNVVENTYKKTTAVLLDTPNKAFELQFFHYWKNETRSFAKFIFPVFTGSGNFLYFEEL